MPSQSPAARLLWNRIVAFLALSILLIAEIVRKYVYPSSVVLAAGEVALFLIALLTVKTWLWTKIGELLALAAVTIAWSLVSVMTGHQNLGLAVVGLRGVSMPVVGLLLGVGISRRLGSQGFGQLLYSFAGFWLLVIGGVALAQLWLGRDHWMNYIDPGLLVDERMGIGDYTVGELGVDWLFRPTSIFLHTGKFGQVAFVLASYRAFYRAGLSISAWQWLSSTLFELTVLLLSGQRAGIALYVMGLCVVALWFSRARLRVLLATAAAIAGITVSFALASLAEDTVAGVVVGRTVSVLWDAVLRANDNLVVPLKFVASEWLLRGEGAGAFSLGSALYGGRPLYEVVPVGVAENSWLRRIAEEGIVGAVLSAALFLLVAGKALRRARVQKGSSQSGTVYWVPFQMAAMALWANTHDVLGNTLTMFLVFAFSGGIAVPVRDR